jgi:flagella basal body P-ring formation protein FlgA
MACAQVVSNQSYEEALSRWIQASLVREQESQNSPDLKMGAQIGAIDGRLKLAPCGHVEPFLPTGARLWGKTRAGMRCVDGISRWSVTVPVTVKATGQAWVVRNVVSAGSVLKPGDLVLGEVDWAEDTQAVVKGPEEWVGQVASRTLLTGQTLRQGMTKPTQVFQAGASVRVVAQGVGFVVTSEAQALSSGVVGQLARVRMDSGRVTSGVVLDTRTVKIEL